MKGIFVERGFGFHKELSFTVKRFSTWVKAQKVFHTHNVSAGHKYAMGAWSEFKSRRDFGSRISNACNEGHSKAVQENRTCMLAFVEALRYTTNQGIAQRGRREGHKSSNRGNFIEFVHSISKFDKVVCKGL